MVRRTVVFLLLAVLCVPAAMAQGGGKRPFTFEDMMKLKRVGEPVPSPDGKWVLFSAVTVDLEKNTRTPHIWIVPADGSAPARQLTSGMRADRPRWSPDGKRFAYLGRDDDGQQIYVVDFDDAKGQLVEGSVKKITAISTEADGHQWSPDGKWFLFASSVYPECADDACNKQKDEEAAKSKVKAEVWDELFFRHWNAYRGKKRSHVFIVAADGSGAPRDLTPGKHDVPPFSLGGQDTYAWSPDSKEIAYTSDVSKVEATSTNHDLFVVDVATGKSKQITTNKGADTTPLYSPDGKWLAYRAQFRSGYESDRWRLMLHERASGKHTNLTEKFDRWVGTYIWLPDSSALYFSAEHKAHALIYGVKAAPDASGVYRIQSLVAGHNDDLAITRDGRRLFFTRMSIQRPNEIYTSDAAFSGCPAQTGDVDKGTAASCNLHQAKPLTDVNGEVFAQVHTSPLEPFWFKGALAKDVEGFLVKPPDFDASKKYPVKFLIHGGPQGMWGDSWSYRWNAQLFAAGGYVVVLINPRGSTGYGQAFIDDINADWGGKVYQDLMLGLDYVQRKYPFLDKTRTCAMGASFGGYMVNWIVTHTGRFQCAVSHDGTFNLESMYGTTEELWFPEWEFKGTPWGNRLLYRRLSPSSYAENLGKFKTPTLVVHGQLDYRLDVGEGFQMFTALQRQGVPSKMLYFPDEGHWVLKPQNSRLWYQTVNGWVDQWLKDGTNMMMQTLE